MSTAIDQATAEEEFNRWADAWEIDSDTANMNEEDKESFTAQKAKVLNAIKRGRLLFDDEKDAMVYTFKFPDKAGCESVEIRRFGGGGIIETDKYKDRENAHKTFAILGQMTGKSTAFFSRLDGIDLKPFLAIHSLFFAS